MVCPKKFQLTVPAPSGAPFAALGAECDREQIHTIHYLPADDFERATVVGPQEEWHSDLEHQLCDYFEDPKSARFDNLLPRLRKSSVMPLGIPDADHRKMLDIVCNTRCGNVIAYSEIAPKIRTSNQNVGTACGKNLIGIVIPCYRVVGRRGDIYLLGGYSKGNPCVDEETGLKIKRWLIEHERGYKVVEPADKSIPMSEWKLEEEENGTSSC